MSTENKVQNLAIYSRLFVIIIQYFSNILIPDHDASVFLYPKVEAEYNVIDRIVKHLFGGFIRWDAQYFMHIAKYGYTYENTLAFFPLYPVIIRFISLIIYSFTPVVSFDSILILVFVGLNTILFLLTTKLLFKLTTIVFNKTIAFNATILFCFNPASIFFTAPYTECMFAYLTFQSIINCLIMYQKYSNSDCKIRYTDSIYLLPIMLSTVVRSNGILNVGFLAYTCLCIYAAYYSRTGFNLRFLFKFIFVTFVVLILCLVPFVTFQIYCYRRFCSNFEAKLPETVISYAKKNNFILPGQFSKHNQSWCYGGLAYSYVQAHYWNVGFLKYYEWKQIPNFLLATPVLFILIKHCCEHIIHNFSKNIGSIFSFDILFNKQKKLKDPIFGSHLNVFVIHALVLSIFCSLFIHVQVTTRMLCSATPLFYWICAHYLRDSKFDSFKGIINYNISLEACIIKVYFLSYFVIGTILFSNFLPWT